jgi:hypothetical protein
VANQLVKRRHNVLIRLRGRRRVGALAAVVLAVTAALLIAFAGRGSGASAESTATSGDASVLSAVMAQLHAPDLSAVTIGNPPADTEASNPPAKWLYVTHTRDQSESQDLLDAWQTSLIAGAYAAQCQEKGVDCLNG